MNADGAAHASKHKRGVVDRFMDDVAKLPEVRFAFRSIIFDARRRNELPVFLQDLV